MSFQVPKDDWFRPKKYLHFDAPLGDDHRSSIEKIVKNKKRVARHNFYPLLTYSVKKYKVHTIDVESGTRRLNSSGKRHLSYAAHLDAQIYSYYSQEMGKLYEGRLRKESIHENIIAFRKLKDINTGESKSNIHLANDAFEEIKTIGNSVVYAFDIKKFFDNLGPKHLKTAWCDLLKVEKLPEDHFTLYKSLSSHSVVSQDDVYKLFEIPRNRSKSKKIFRICNPKDFRDKVRGDSLKKPGGSTQKGLINIKNKGIPQGSPISALLANIYMLKFDIILNTKIKSLGGKYFRYCDDILCIIPLEKDFHIEPFISNELKNIGLSLNEDKTEKSEFKLCDGILKADQSIQYLGFMFDGKRKYLRTSSISRYRRRAKAAIRLAEATRNKYNKIRESRNLGTKDLYRKKILKRYFHTGNSNFIRYGLRAAEIMKSKEIKKQIKKLNQYILSATEAIGS